MIYGEEPYGKDSGFFCLSCIIRLIGLILTLEVCAVQVSPSNGRPSPFPNLLQNHSRVVVVGTAYCRWLSHRGKASGEQTCDIVWRALRFIFPSVLRVSEAPSLLLPLRVAS